MSASATIEGPEIAAGYPWRHTLAIMTVPPSELFAAGASLRAEVRVAPYGKVLGELTTANGGLTIIDGHQVGIDIPGAWTARFPPAVTLEIVRVSGADEEPVGVQLTIPVRRPATAARSGPA